MTARASTSRALDLLDLFRAAVDALSWWPYLKGTRTDKRGRFSGDPEAFR